MVDLDEGAIVEISGTLRRRDEPNGQLLYAVRGLVEYTERVKTLDRRVILSHVREIKKHLVAR